MAPQKPHMEPAATYRRVPLQPHQRHQRITPTESAFVLAHLGIPHIDAATWSLAVEGLVRRPLTLDAAGLRLFPQRELESFHQCAGAPRDPRMPMRRVMNVVWGGVRLADVLEEAGLLPAARFVWSFGLDHGTYGGHAVENYVKDLPIERVTPEVLIATELNGAPLPVEHGYPARLLIPGFYGTNSVKWLCRIVLADRRADSPFTTALYNDPAPQGGTRPVWAVAPESALVAPAPDAVLDGGETLVWGWAWGEAPIARVEVSTDGGDTWTAAELEPRRQFAWQRFSLAWRPQQAGPAVVMARAVDAAGAAQPLTPARNAVHAVKVTVTG